MERLVIKDADGNPYYYDAERGLKLESYEVQPLQRTEVLERLHTYEDTGLTPQEIMELKERDTEYFCKTSMFDHESVVCKCGNDIEKDSGFKFCPYCGNRIKLEE